MALGNTHSYLQFQLMIEMPWRRNFGKYVASAMSIFNNWKWSQNVKKKNSKYHKIVMRSTSVTKYGILQLFKEMKPKTHLLAHYEDHFCTPCRQSKKSDWQHWRVTGVGSKFCRVDRQQTLRLITNTDRDRSDTDTTIIETSNQTVNDGLLIALRQRVDGGSFIMNKHFSRDPLNSNERSDNWISLAAKALEKRGGSGRIRQMVVCFARRQQQPAAGGLYCCCSLGKNYYFVGCWRVSMG